MQALPTHHMMNTIYFGSIDDAKKVAKRIVYGFHPPVKGEFEGVTYSASSIYLMLWILSPYTWSLPFVYSVLVRPLSQEELDSFIETRNRFLHLFGIPIQAQFNDWEDFIRYMHDASHHLQGDNSLIEEGFSGAGYSRFKESVLRGTGSVALKCALTLLPQSLSDRWTIKTNPLHRLAAYSLLGTIRLLMTCCPDSLLISQYYARHLEVLK